MNFDIPTTYTIANNGPTLAEMLGRVKQKEEEQKMFDECTTAPVPACFKTKRAFISAPVANAQVISNVPVEATQRDHAIARVKQIGEKHDAALRVQFNMDPKNPQTFLELEAAIKAGDYTIGDLAKSEEAKFYNIFYGVTFGKAPDPAGYKAAREVLKEALQTAVDNVTLADIDTLLAEIEDFKEWTLPTD